MRAKTLVTCATDGAQQGLTFEKLGVHSPGAMLCIAGRIAKIGAPHEVEAGLDGQVEVCDVGDAVIVPGLVDAHTHPLFAGDREADFCARLRGEPPPLGMLATVAQTRKALEDVHGQDALWERVRGRLRLMARHGTTTMEVKTGYALHKEGEMQLLDWIAAHADETGLPRLIGTFLGAHALPPEFFSPEAFIEYLVDHLLPVARAHGAVYADAFCEPGFFSPAQAERYLLAARAQGLRLRVHCDEFAAGGGAAMAAKLGVDAVDHANCISEQNIDALVAADVVTVACPATIAYLGLSERTPARAILTRGGLLALASDYNPGTSPCFNLQTVAYFGRALFGLSAAEALYGVTRAAARSLRVQAGSLEVGASADWVALAINSPQEFGWQFGGNLATMVMRAGQLIS